MILPGELQALALGVLSFFFSLLAHTHTHKRNRTINNFPRCLAAFFCICCTAQSFSFHYYPGKTLISFNCTFFSAILGVCSLCYPADSGGFPWIGKFAYPLYWQQSRSPSRTDYCFRLPERPSAPTNGWKTQAAYTRKGVRRPSDRWNDHS